jgi:hypothetical protein
MKWNIAMLQTQKPLGHTKFTFVLLVFRPDALSRSKGRESKSWFQTSGTDAFIPRRR